MSADLFGNLRDWGPVMDQIAGLTKSKKLDEHQVGLARILRYQENWRLREAVLKAAKDISLPSDEILSQMTEIMMDENIYWEARLLAADALSRLVLKSEKGSSHMPPHYTAKVMEKMNVILNSPQPPIFREGIGRLLMAIKEAKGACRAEDQNYGGSATRP